MMLELHNMRMKPSTMRKNKNKRTTKCDRSTITCYFGTAPCEDETIKCEKKGTTKCYKSTVKCYVGIVECDNGIIKYEKK